MRDDLAYSSIKAVRHLDIVESVREGKPARPAHVQMILSDLCNQFCTMCAYRSPDYTSSQLFYEIKPQGAGLRRDAEHLERNYNPNRMMPTEKALEIINDCAEMNVSGIQSTGGGEPTVNPDFQKIMSYAQERGLKTSLVTNGVNVGKRFHEWSSTLLKLSWIRFSIDAGTTETYMKTREVPDWHMASTLKGMRELRAARDVLGTHQPVIGVGYVVTPDNWKEVLLGVRLAKENGADNVRISAQFSTQDEKLFESFHKECAIYCREAEALTDDHFTVYNRFGEKLADLRQHRPDYQHCGYQFFTTYIGADLNVYRCCVLAYNPRGVVGNLKEQRFRDLWLDEKRAAKMDRFDARGCDRCQFNGINRNLDYILSSEDPLHSEFV